MKTLQYFTDEYIEQCRTMTPLQIITYLDGFRQMIGDQRATPKIELKPICIKMPENLLSQLKKRAKKQSIPYQTLIKTILEREVGSLTPD